MRFTLKIAVLWVLWTGAALAQTPEQGIIVTGEGRVSLAPDMARITLGVQDTAATAKDVVGEVQARAASVMAQLEAIGVAPRDMQTEGISLNPMLERRRDDDDGVPRITGFQAGNSITIRVRDLTQLGEVLDRAIQAGITEFRGLSFALQDDTQARADARALAVADAMARARQLAEAADVSLGGVLRMTESADIAAPFLRATQMSAAGLGTAVAGGEVDVTVVVTMVFGIAPSL